MKAAAGAAAGAGVGVAAMRSADKRMVALVDGQIDRDTQTLVRTGRLEPLPAPVPMSPRRPRSSAALWVLGILGTGFVFWLVSTLAMVGACALVGTRGSEALAGTLFIPPFVGVVGMFCGIAVALALRLREAQARYTEAYTEVHVRPWWHWRQGASRALGQGTASPEQVLNDMQGWRLGGPPNLGPLTGPVV